MEESDSTGTVERQGYPTVTNILHTHTLQGTVQYCKACSDSDDGSHVNADGLYVCSYLSGHKVRVCCVMQPWKKKKRKEAVAKDCPKIRRTEKLLDCFLFAKAEHMMKELESLHLTAT